MNRTLATVLLLLLFVLTLPLAQGDKPAERPKIEPKADDILKKSCRYLADLKQCGLQVEETFDEMSAAGQKLQFTNHRKVLFHRPNLLMADSAGDTTKQFFYYDGKTITLFDPVAKVYAVKEAPDTLDGMFDFLNEILGFSIPTADLLFADPYKVLTEQVEEGDYVGLHRVGKKKCHHLAFRQRSVDWQLWIDAGDKPLPLKFLITYRRMPGEPQFASTFKWDESARIADDAFTFKPPSEAKKIKFVTQKDKAPKETKPAKP
jgi:hypothetical protein